MLRVEAGVSCIDTMSHMIFRSEAGLRERIGVSTANCQHQSRRYVFYRVPSFDIDGMIIVIGNVASLVP